MPAYEELDEVLTHERYQIRMHSVNRQDETKSSYDWPKLRITSDSVDIADMLAEWYNAVGGAVNGSLTDLLQNGLNHAISVAKDPDRVSADPEIKQFKADFRKALGEKDMPTLDILKDENYDLFIELRDDHKRKIEEKMALLG
jgi:hypothetical protein